MGDYAMTAIAPICPCTLTEILTKALHREDPESIVEHDLIEPETAAGMQAWHHSDVSAHHGVALNKEDRPAHERTARRSNRAIHGTSSAHCISLPRERRRDPNRAVSSVALGVTVPSPPSAPQHASATIAM